MRRVAAAVAPVAFGLAMLALAAFVLMAYGCSASEDPGPPQPPFDELFDDAGDPTSGRRREMGAASAPAPPPAFVPPAVEARAAGASTQVHPEGVHLARPLRTCRGVVVDGDGRPVKGARVTLASTWLPLGLAWLARPPGGAQVRSRIVTRADGGFEVSYAEGGAVELSVNAPDGAPLTGWRCVVERPSERQRVVLGAPGAIEVRVRSRPDGMAPVDGASVSVMSVLELGDPPPAADGATDANGRCRVGGLPGGAVYVVVHSDGLASELRQRVEVVSGVTTAVDVVLSRGTWVRGRVVDAETGAAVAGAEVRIGGVGFPVRNVVVRTTARDGTFELEGLAHREGVSEPLAVTATGYVRQRVWVSHEEVDGGDVEVEVRLARGGRLALRCVNGERRALADVMVAGLSSQRVNGDDRAWDGGELLAFTDDDGRALLEDVAAGQRPVELRFYVGGFEVRRLNTPAPAPRETVELGDVVLAHGRTLAGTVVDASGRPAVGAFVLVTATDPSDEHFYVLADAALSARHEKHSPVDADGRFEIRGLSAGTWDLLAWSERNEHPPRLVPGIVVPVTEDPPPLSVLLPRAVAIEGRVLDERGEPLVGVEVAALRDVPVPFNLVESTTTDAAGHFSIAGFSVEDSQVWVRVEDRGEERGRLVIPSEGPVDLRFDLLDAFDPDEYDRAMGR